MIYSADKLSPIPQNIGVYLFKDAQHKIIYIGKAINLKKRIISHFQRKSDKDKEIRLTNATKNIEVIEVNSEFEALLLEAELIKKYLPKYNVIWKDDKSYIYILITKEDFPKALLSRKVYQESDVFGPFPSKRTAKDILIFLRKIFPFCTQKKPYKRVCFYHHLGLCDPCPGEIIKQQGLAKDQLRKKYLENINNLRKILSGKIGKVKNILEKDMHHLAKFNQFEKALLIRDRIKKLALLNSYQFHPDEYIKNPQFTADSWIKEQQTLASILKKYMSLPPSLTTIECYDISNLSGKLATGSMVTFSKGRPDKLRYRHFRIRSLATPNDYQMLRQVLFRRLKHQEWPLPDLIMVDGGSVQLSVLLTALKYYKIDIPAIALAKRNEEIYLSKNGQSVCLKLADDSPALNLVKRIRDEAHRFAHRYHQHLRLKNLLNVLHA